MTGLAVSMTEPVPRASARPPLSLIRSLARLLDESGVGYCHWKSNAAIDRSASGENDVDLLVRRADVRPFVEILSRLGFTRAHRSGEAVPGIESFYGFDGESDRWVHVHAHYQLILGDDRTKNYRLPIEEAYISSAAPAGLFRLPAPELEYVVFVIRMVLKYCTPDEILWAALRGRRARMKRTERAELEYLAERTGEGAIESSLRELPYVGGALFADCVHAIGPGASVRRRTRTARRLERALQPHARRSRHVDCALRIWRRVALAVAYRARRIPKSRLAAGGGLVAIIGGDGAGKTTALAGLERWLGLEFDVRLVHLGKPRWSATTYVVRGTLKAVGLTAGALARLVPVAPVRRLSDSISSHRPLFWLVCTARDRQRAYRRARRFAIDGGLVLCDRYPHPSLRSMEAPLIAGLSGEGPRSRLVRSLSALEQRYHRSIAPPELLAVLRVHPDVAVERKQDERPESVRARGAEIWSIDWRGSGVHVVDASRQPDEVLGELKALVWSALA